MLLPLTENRTYNYYVYIQKLCHGKIPKLITNIYNYKYVLKYRNDIHKK